MQHPRIRDSLFGLADARGNNPHGTREDAVSEGRRLNAQRYETVQQIDEALDERARRRRPRGMVRRPLGAVESPPPQVSGSFFGSALLIAIGAGLAYLFTRKDEPEEFEDDELRRNPAQQTVPVVVVAPAPNPQSQTQAPVVVPVVVPPPVVSGRKRRSRRKAEPEATTAT